MEMHKKTPLLFVLLHLLLQVCAYCPSLPEKNLTCHNDFNHTITCVWNSPNMSDDTSSVCTLYSEKPFGLHKKASCTLEPVDASRPALKKCSLVFATDYVFMPTSELPINLSCKPLNLSVKISYWPICHIKLQPPTKPDINFTAVSWLPQVTKHLRIPDYYAQLQWKRQDQPWNNRPLPPKPCKNVCQEMLPFDELIQGERYEARVRVQSVKSDIKGNWSDWSPTASWVSQAGKIKQPAVDVEFVGIYITAGLVVFALLLAVVISRADKTTWVYMVKRIPNPAHSFLQDANFQSWSTPHFTSESFHSFLKPVDIASVEVTSTVDVVTPFRPDEKMMRNDSSYDSTSSSFSNPSYSNLCTPPPLVSLQTAGNLKPCDADTPYGPVGCQGEGNNTEQGNNDVTEKEMEILKLLSKGSSDSDSVQVISDYEKVEKVQVQALSLQGLDSGMCSCEEVIQESMEADSISVTDSHDEGPEEDEEKEGGHSIKVNFLKLFGSSGAIFGKEPIQVCSDYERVQAVHSPEADSPELPSLDSGVCSGGEEQVSQEESMEDVDKSTESTRFLFPPRPSSPLPCSLLSLKQLPLNISGSGFSPVLQMQHDHSLEKITWMSTSRSVEPCADDYMPVRQEQG